MRLQITALAFAVLTLAQPAAADCTKPGSAPNFPQGASASLADMKAAHDSLQAYVNDLTNYQQCLEGQISSASASEDVKNGWRTEANGVLEQEKSVAAAYHAQLEAFKAKNH